MLQHPLATCCYPQELPSCRVDMLHTGHPHRKEDQSRGKYTDAYRRTRQYNYCTSGEYLFKPHSVEAYFLESFMFVIGLSIMYD
jgi:hypothetical protein